MRSVQLVLLLLLVTSAATAEINNERALFNYQMLCQGCHTENGRGFRSVPKIDGTIGHFLRSQQGREYLVRVPGSANAYLSDTELAEVLNWMIVRFAGNSKPNNWQKYSAGEVSQYRAQPLLEVETYRQILVENLRLETEEAW